MIKRWHRRLWAAFRSVLKHEQGFNLVEVLVALMILAAVAATFLMSVSTSSKAVMVGHDQVSAEGLAKSQMESIQQQNYSASGTYTHITGLTGYNVDFTVQRLDPQQLHTVADEGLQKITITVTHAGQTIWTLQGYKCYTGH
jgi:type II secretion system protein I